jgi:hypothetical protein
MGTRYRILSPYGGTYEWPTAEGPVTFTDGVTVLDETDRRLACFRTNPRYRVAALDEPAASTKESR